MAKVFPLRCAVQTYAWGKLGSKSEVASLASTAETALKVDEKTPYAELWMGTHPKGPCTIVGTGEALSSWVAKNPDCLGSKVKQHFNLTDQLPFLLKVLSVEKALSIQAHPNKTHAVELHNSKPDKYPDDNHKPEMAIALTPFEGMCGFRPKQEIVKFMRNVPELLTLVGSENVESLDKASSESEVKSSLQQCFSALMLSKPGDVEQKLSELVNRIGKMSAGDKSSCQGDLIERLSKQFPGDVGCFVAFFLNHMKLKEGEAMFLEANLPHAYLSGDCVECMACSDNVVRAGLTPKFKDVDVLCSMLKYECKPAKDNLFNGKSLDPFTTVFKPSVQDFAVAKICVPDDVNHYSLAKLDGPSIVIVIKGAPSVTSASLGNEKLKLQRGSILFISANEIVDISTAHGSLLFRAYCEF